MRAVWCPAGLLRADGYNGVDLHRLHDRLNGHLRRTGSGRLDQREGDHRGRAGQHVDELGGEHGVPSLGRGYGGHWYAVDGHALELRSCRRVQRDVGLVGAHGILRADGDVGRRPCAGALLVKVAVTVDCRVAPEQSPAV